MKKLVFSSGDEPDAVVMTVEVQGVHSLKPPAKKIGQAMLAWLMSLAVVAEHDRTRRVFELQIVRDIPAHRSAERVRGRKASRFNPLAIEVLVFVKGRNKPWLCYLVCPDAAMHRVLSQEILPQVTLAAREEGYVGA